LCNAHLLRELQAAFERGYTWAKNLQDQFKELLGIKDYHKQNLSLLLAWLFFSGHDGSDFAVQKLNLLKEEGIVTAQDMDNAANRFYRLADFESSTLIRKMKEQYFNGVRHPPQ
jgi:hypothetical protein